MEGSLLLGRAVARRAGLVVVVVRESFGIVTVVVVTVVMGLAEAFIIMAAGAGVIGLRGCVVMRVVRWMTGPKGEWQLGFARGRKRAEAIPTCTLQQETERINPSLIIFVGMITFHMKAA